MCESECMKRLLAFSLVLDGHQYVCEWCVYVCVCVRYINAPQARAKACVSGSVSVRVYACTRV